MNVTQNLVDNILKAKTVYFHTGCPDGIMARNFINQILSDGYNKQVMACYIAISPGNILEVTPNCVFVDCSPIESQYEDFLKAGAVILDHHITNKPKNFDDLQQIYPDQIVFGDNSLNESGTMLAFRAADFYMKSKNYISWNTAQTNHVATLIAIGDCWDSTHVLFEKGRYLGQYIAMYGNDYTDIPGQLFLNQAFAYGNLRKKQIERVAERVIFRSYGELKLAFMNTHDGMSDVAEILRQTKDIDLVIGWVVQQVKVNGVPTEVTSFSMRSNEKFDCSKLAKFANPTGGGHPRAAGFLITSIENGQDCFTNILIKYSACNSGKYV